MVLAFGLLSQTESCAMDNLAEARAMSQYFLIARIGRVLKYEAGLDIERRDQETIDLGLRVEAGVLDLL